MRDKGLSTTGRRAPTIINGTVPPRRLRNADVRPREYLTPDEVGRLAKVAAGGKETSHRDATMILLAYRHGLRASELAAVRWDQLDSR